MVEAEHPFLVNEEGVDTNDDDPSNMMIRAGYLAGMSMKLDAGDDRNMLQRAARSLVFAAKAARELRALRILRDSVRNAEVRTRATKVVHVEIEREAWFAVLRALRGVG